MDHEELLKKCQRLQVLLRELKLNPQLEPYQSIAVAAVSKALTEIGRELQKHDRIHGGESG